jgi:hypothetical protein
MVSPFTATTGGRYERLHALAIKMIPITEAQLTDVQALAGD